MASPRIVRRLVAGLLLVHAVLLLVSARLNFVTLDESSHIPAGLWHWRTGRFEMYRVNPPLPRLLATLPLLAADPDTDFGTLSFQPGSRPEFAAGPRFAEANALRYLDLLWLARLAGVGWSVLGGWLVFRWAADLYGPGAGLLGLALWCCSPDVLAHAPLVTPDLPATVAGLAACYLFWHHLREPSWGRAWFAGLLLGVALLCKFTWLVLFGLWPLAAVLFWAGNRGVTAGPGTRLGQVALALLLGLVVLNLGYGFTGTGRPLGEFRFVSGLLGGEDAGPADNRFEGTWPGSLPVPLPADAVLGLDAQRRDFEGNWPSYLGGEWQAGGRWYFYLYSLALKEPLGTLGLVAAAAVMALRRPGVPWRDEAYLWLVPVAVVAVASSQTGLNYHRYVLPAVPFLLIAAGGTARLVRRETWKRGLLVLTLAAWSVVSGLVVVPHSLSYFNELAGGPEGGSRHLVDSNADWGQDLLFLRDWLREHPEVKDLKLAYFHHVDPRVVGIEYELPPPGEPGPGWFAVSVHFVRGGGFVAPDGRGGWRMIPQGTYGYFSEMRPVAAAGHSIFIYHVTD